MASSKARTLVGNKQRPKVLPRRQSSVGSHEHYLRREQELEDEIDDLQRELERSEKRLEAMKVVQQTLASGLDPNRLLMQLINRTTQLLGADRTTLFLIDTDTGDLVSSVIQADEMKNLVLPRGTGLAGWVADSGEPVHIEDAYNDKRFNRDIDKRSGYRTRCMLVWPVRHPRTDQVMGVIQVLNKLIGNFDNHDKRLLDSIASSVGVALEVMLLYQNVVEQNETIERSRSKLQLLYETETIISQAVELNEMFEVILETALDHLFARSALIYMIDQQNDCIEVAAAAGSNQKQLMRLYPDVDDPVLSVVLHDQEPCIYNEIEEGEIVRGRIRLRSLLAVPIRNRNGDLLGILELINRKVKRPFGADAVQALSVVAGQAGRAIYALQQRDERERASRLASIGGMLSGVVHDIRTPMTLITGYSQLMARSSDEEVRDEYAREIKKQIQVMNSMTKELLGFARGDHTILVRKVYLERFMENMEKHLLQEMKGTGVKLSIRVRYKGPARFDENKLRRVFHNLARNACEAMPGGGLFEVVVSKRMNRLRFDFIDNGPGIPDEVKPRLFQPFATSGKKGGTGLGLAMVKQIAEEHHGKVAVKSSPDGTKFSLVIPLETS